MIPKKNVLSVLSISLYVVFLIYNINARSSWILDTSLSILFLFFIYSSSRWLKLGLNGMIMINVPLLLHNLGSFGAYNWSWWVFGWDNLVHFVGTFVAGFLIYNLVARKLHIKKNQRVKFTVIDEHKLIIVFLVMASVVFLGTIVELVEFAGFLKLGSDQSFGGVFSVDAEGSQAAKEYIDTMSDIVVNILGASFGVITYYLLVYRKKPWLKY